MMSAPAPAEKHVVFNHPHFVEKSSRDIFPNTLDAATVLPASRTNARPTAITGRIVCPENAFMRCAKKIYILI
jgi:hypothetical protein